MNTLARCRVVAATDELFKMRKVYDQQAIAVVLQQLVEQPTLPVLFMRIVIKAAVAWPKLKPFVIDVLQKLVARSVWTNEKLWDGFKLAVKMLAPKSFPVLVRLPVGELESILKQFPEMKAPLTGSLRQNATLARSVPRATLKSLGI